MKKWSKKEITTLQSLYPVMGYNVCILFPKRTKAAVLRKAELLNLKVNKKLEQLQEDRIGYLDIEASQLKANFGIMYSWYIKVQGKNEFYSAHITREELLDGTLDKRVVQELVDTLKHFTLIYTYYGSRFDIPFVRTRALIHNIEFIPRGIVQHRDLYYLARRVLCLHSKRLEVVCSAFGIKGKTHLEERFWVRANTGDPESIEYICKHNKADVVILEKAHLRLAPFESMGRRWL
jgi:uncharacterized protein YprB with RNaseH-like and TPR domain